MDSIKLWSGTPLRPFDFVFDVYRCLLSLNQVGMESKTVPDR